MSPKTSGSQRPAQPRKAAMAGANHVIADPGISFGRFRVLRRTDGQLVVYDPDLPLGRRTVQARTFRGEDLSGVTQWCEDLARLDPAPAR